MDTIRSSRGCDSIITTVSLLVLPGGRDTIYPSTCDSFTSPSGKYTWDSSGTYLDTLTSKGGCDSFVTVVLKVNPPTKSNITVKTCNGMVSPSGKYRWTTSGVYRDTLVNSNGCDSIIVVDLGVNPVDVSIRQSGNALSANQEQAAYQWLNCSKGFLRLSGETSRSFIPEFTGEYAVEVTRGGCTDTSRCHGHGRGWFGLNDQG